MLTNRRKSPSRRAALAGLAVGVLVAPFGFGRRAFAQADAAPAFAVDPFRLGVASGDPDATSVVLWTRLAPEPLAVDGGMPDATVLVAWEIANDAAMADIVGGGTTVAQPASAHSVHVLATGLSPGRTYWYRFQAGGAASRIGRTRTLPAPGADTRRFRIAVAGCQRIEQGHFTAWREIADSDLDLVLHTGDYIYEYALPSGDIDRRMGFAVPDAALRKLAALGDYRLRYALYRLDPHLAAAHAAHPFVMSFDDHEVANDWAGDNAPKMSRDAFLMLRRAAFQAYYENMPVREAMRPRQSAMQAYRAIAVGNLLQLAVLDTRQYRSPHACDLDGKVRCAARSDPGRTMLGADQEAWLLDRLGRGETRWNVLGNQVMMMQCRYSDTAGDIVDIDKWDGYAAARQRLLGGAAARRNAGRAAWWFLPAISTTGWPATSRWISMPRGQPRSAPN